jgi:hypothetical protein
LYFAKTARVDGDSLIFDVNHDDGIFSVEVHHSCLVRYYGCGKETKAEYYRDKIEQLKYSVRRAFHKKNLKYIKKAERSPPIPPDLKVTITIEKWISYMNDEGKLTESGTITVTFYEKKKISIIEIDTLADKSHLAIIADQKPE